jgi:hypothetical protein
MFEKYWIKKLETLVNVSPPKPGGGNSRKRGIQASQSNHTKQCKTIPNLALPNHTKQCKTIPNLALPNHTKQCKTIPNLALPNHTKQCKTIPNLALPNHTKQCKTIYYESMPKILNYQSMSDCHIINTTSVLPIRVMLMRLRYGSEPTSQDV